jgi:hypothetical protein
MRAMPSNSLNHFLSSARAFELLLLPVNATYEGGSDDSGFTGLYTLHARGGVYTLTTPNGTGVTTAVYATGALAIEAIKAFLIEWPLKLHQNSQATFNVHANGSLRYAILKTTMNAIRTGDAFIPVNVNEFSSLRENPNLSLGNFLGQYKSYTAGYRGDRIREHNVSVLSKTASDFSRVFSILELIESTVGSDRASITYNIIRDKQPTTRKDLILYRFATTAMKLKLGASIVGTTSSVGKLKDVQITAAEAFARREVKCSLLYWSPGVGKTTGAWACILNVLRENRDTETLGVIFLSSGKNLPQHKFINELEQNRGMFGAIGITNMKRDTVSTGKGTNLPLGWSFTFTITINDRECEVCVFASTYMSYARCAAMTRWNEEFTNSKLFTAPRSCDCVINVCDEAHVLRGTAHATLVRGKTTQIDQYNDELDEEDGSDDEDIGNNAFSRNKKRLQEKLQEKKEMLTEKEIVDSDQKIAHAWSIPSEHTAYTKVVWEALRLKESFYFINETGNKIVKTLVLTATPFGNTEYHFYNLLTCALYATNENIPEFEEKSVTLDRVTRITNQDNFVTSLATVDQATAPYQNFSSCHVYLGEGGSILAAAASSQNAGNVPWSNKNVYTDTVLQQGLTSNEIEESQDINNSIYVVDTMYKQNGPDQDVSDNQFVNTFLHTGIYYLLIQGAIYPVKFSSSKDDKKYIENSIDKVNYAYFRSAIESEKNTRSTQKKDNTALETMQVEKWDANSNVRVKMDADALVKLNVDLYEHLRAYSRKYEQLLYALESMPDPTPTMLFFTVVQRSSESIGCMSSLSGFIRYTQMRNKNFHKDHLGSDMPQTRYWFLTFDKTAKTKHYEIDVDQQNAVKTSVQNEIELGKETFASFTIAQCLYFYSLRETAIPGSMKDYETVLRLIIREKMWQDVDHSLIRVGELEIQEEAFITIPNLNHVICSVVGDDKAAGEWATYMCDDMSGMYNHPLNRNGLLVRVMAGADKIAESNDFRNTRHMFFTSPETDVVKLIQKTGRIARNSNPTMYPYYTYGFHADHCTVVDINNQEESVRPIVHYVTLASSEECKSAYGKLKLKSTYYNKYALLLAKGTSGENLRIHKVRNKATWIAKAKSLNTPVRFNAFKTSDTRFLSNLYGEVEWLFAASKFKKKTVIHKWLTKGAKRQWNTADFNTTVEALTPKETTETTETTETKKHSKYSIYKSCDDVPPSGYLALLVSIVFFSPESDESKHIIEYIEKQEAEEDKKSLSGLKNNWKVMNLERSIYCAQVRDNEVLLADNTYLIQLMKAKFENDPYKAILSATAQQSLFESRYNGNRFRKSVYHEQMNGLLEIVRDSITDTK